MEQKTALSAQDLYIRRIHRIGTTSMMVILLLTFVPVFYIYIAFDAFPGIGVVCTTFCALFAYNAVQWIMEAVLYFPMVGVPGAYICFTAGNILTMRVPCALAAQNAIGAKNGTLRGDMASVFGMLSSVVVNFVFLAIVILFGSYLISILPESVRSAFSYVMPALYGAIVVMTLDMFLKK